LSRPTSPRPSFGSPSYVRINGKIRAREVRVIGPDNQQIGVVPLHEAITMARNKGMDLVEIAPNATPPVCRIVDYGKFRYEQAKREKESKKHQHANRVKEIQLSASIDPHDFGVKLSHAVGFLCDDMKVKVTMRFRGREMIHKEVGIQVVERLIKEVTPYGQADAPPKLIGKSLNVMISPLPRARRAKNPYASENPEGAPPPLKDGAPLRQVQADAPVTIRRSPEQRGEQGGNGNDAGGFSNNPFSRLDAGLGS